MKNYKFLFYALLMLLLGACSSKTIGINEVDDDVYWSRHSEPKSGQSYKDVEKWNNNKGPNPGVIESNYAPAYQNIEAAQEQTAVNTDEIRAQEAYRAWNAKRGFTSQEDTTKQSNVLIDDKNENRDARRFGSDRQYYYDDPYYNSLSTNWGWTSLFTPVVRPGFYNWAPGWNIGLNWNNNNGFNWGVGYNTGFGMNTGFGFSPFNNFYDPYWGYGNPYAFNPYMGFGPYYGYNPYYGFGYNPFYDPWGYGYGWGNGWGNGWGCRNGWGNRRNNNFNNNGNDIVTNRPIMRPRNSMGSAVPAAGSRPGASGEKVVSRPNGGVNQAVDPSNQPAYVRPNAGGGSVYRPNRPVVDPNNVSTNRPGGDLGYDNNGRPVYISPNTNSRPSAPSGTSTYSNRAGGELRSGSDGKPVYVPSRPRDNGSSNVPSNSGYQPARQASPSSNDNPSYERPSRSMSNQDSRPANRGNSSSTPSYSAPSNSQPSQSRPGSSAPSSPRPSSSGGSSGSTGGGNSRPR